MGQYWTITCLDTHESTGCFCELGGTLYSSIPKLIEELIILSKFALAPLPIKSAAVFCFALTCHRFLEIGRQTIAMRKKKYIAPWAGKRIICAGDYVEDYPENVLTEKEKAIMSYKSLYVYAADFRYPSVLNGRSINGILKAVNHDHYYVSRRMQLLNWLPIPCPVSTDETKAILPEYKLGFGHIILLHGCGYSDP
ncbi:hypothetical protein BX667DRAFT_501150 [Coemansia mojavensis]|nr:hypothetical protein BX667DRAFT_501150 [Coemansia mojavensis]